MHRVRVGARPPPRLLPARRGRRLRVAAAAAGPHRSQRKPAAAPTHRPADSDSTMRLPASGACRSGTQAGAAIIAHAVR